MTHTQHFTPETAREFDGYSVANAAAIRAALTCQCQPYADVFTFARWLAQGRCVRKGQHGIRILTLVPIQKRDETGELKTVGTMRKRAVVFCHCQTEETRERN